MPKSLQWDSDWEELKIPTRERVVDWERLGITGEWRIKVFELLHEIDILEEKLAGKEKLIKEGKAIIKNIGKSIAKDVVVTSCVHLCEELCYGYLSKEEINIMIKENRGGKDEDKKIYEIKEKERDKLEELKEEIQLLRKILLEISSLARSKDLEITELKCRIKNLKLRIELNDFYLKLKDIGSRMTYEMIEEVAVLKSKNGRLERKIGSKKEKINYLREESEKLRKELKRSEIIIRGFIVFVSIGIIFIVAKFFLKKKANSEKNNTSKRPRILPKR